MDRDTQELLCLFSGKIRRDSNGDFVVTIPSSEINHGTIQPGNAHRIGIFDEVSAEPGALQGRSRDPEGPTAQQPPTGEPPVEEGEELTVKIEGKGEEGDGVAKVPPGYVIMVPETEVGEEVKIQVTATRENVGFGTVVGRLG
jgi:predicted RNA-binding protein with TRAM domain